MTQITLAEAQQHLPEIISGLQPGEEVKIIQDDRPIARLIVEGLRPLEGHPITERQARIPGQADCSVYRANHWVTTTALIKNSHLE
jgi:antitoxin (DNA-binding transcriptional repressor) of toxin-antitoxin stability system